jgi:hypothetical protein
MMAVTVPPHSLKHGEGIPAGVTVEAEIAKPPLKPHKRPRAAVIGRPVVLAVAGVGGVSQVELRHSPRPQAEQLERERIQVTGFQPSTAQKPPLVGSSGGPDSGRAAGAVDERVRVARSRLRCGCQHA